jgi:hypothetical protein
MKAISEIPASNQALAGSFRVPTGGTYSGRGAICISGMPAKHLSVLE